jgi:hypothetical protein
VSVRRLLRPLLFVLCLATPGLGAAESAPEKVVSVSSRRLQLAQLWPACPRALCNVDLGPAPPPGTSLLLARDAIVRALGKLVRELPELSLPEAVRVKSEGRVLSPDDVNELAYAAVQGALPIGVTLSRVESKLPLTVPLTATFGRVELPRLPRRAGPLTTSGQIEIVHEGAVVGRMPLTLQLVISEGAARPDVPKGSDLTLVITRNAATISARGVAMQDAEIGQIALFKVPLTGKILRARVESADRAVVLEGGR